jgi:hypothetical protein
MNPVQSAKTGGYASLAYAQSLDEFGTVRPLPASGGSLLVRTIGGSDARDGMGCYPVFSCSRWNALGQDLDYLAEDLVSVCLVTDPFADVTSSQLAGTFPDVCYPYKDHYVVDLQQPLDHVVASHHRRNVRKAMKLVEVHPESSGPELLQTWQALYGNLVARHGITGLARFSPASFARQVRVPGFTAFAGRCEGQTCGVVLWYVCGDVAYYHLAAYSDRGYDAGASFALFWESLSHFASIGVRWAALGAGAGVNSTESGLTRFKQGWATETRPVYFCGRVLQPQMYRRLSENRIASSSFFPAYRSPPLKAAS